MNRVKINGGSAQTTADNKATATRLAREFRKARAFLPSDQARDVLFEARRDPENYGFDLATNLEMYVINARQRNAEAVESSDKFKQWLSCMPKGIKSNEITTINCEVSLFTTTWIALCNVSRFKGWSLEETINEMLMHCGELFETDEEGLLRHFEY